jgi:hypothetical protein
VDEDDYFGALFKCVLCFLSFNPAILINPNTLHRVLFRHIVAVVAPQIRKRHEKAPGIHALRSRYSRPWLKGR